MRMESYKSLFFLLLTCLANLGSSAWAATAEFYDKTALRVCADPSNLPFSNDKEQGFENKIASLLAKKMGLKLEYTWYPQSVGFARNTLLAGECDLVIGVLVPSGIMQNTNTYYHSTYAMVYKADAKFKPKSFKNEKFPADIKIGVIEASPGVDLLAKNQLLSRMHSHSLVVDTRYTASGKEMIKDLLDDKLDMAILWGPIAGYFTKQNAKKLVLVPLDGNVENVPLDFKIGMGMRFNEPTFKEKINELIINNQAEISKILKEYNVVVL